MNKPLVILTRTESDNARIAPVFEDQGLSTLSIPLLEIRDLEIEPWEIPDDTGPYLVLLTSSRSTTRWLALREKLVNHDLRGYMVVGRQSALRLHDSDPETPILLISHSVEELLEDVVNLRRPYPHSIGEVAPEAVEILGEGSPVTTILYPCSAIRLDEAMIGLQTIGLRVLEIPLYEPILPAESKKCLTTALATLDVPAVVTFFSPSAVSNFFRIIDSSSKERKIERNVIQHIRFAAIGETTAEALYQRGIEEVIVSDLPDTRMLAEKIAAEWDR